MTRLFSLAALSVILPLACGACRKPEPPPTERKPEPQATQLQKTLKQSIDKAKEAEKALRDNAENAGQRRETESRDRYGKLIWPGHFQFNPTYFFVIPRRRE